jgi:pyruvate dehydrogenase E1 component alpha subunit
VENGQEVLDVHAAVSTAVERARRGEGPSFVEVVTYRFNEHSEGLRMAKDYRDADEKKLWLARDPIVLHRTWLLEQGIATEEQLDAMDAEVREEVEESVRFTDASPLPELGRAFADLYTEPFGPTHSEHGRGAGLDNPIGAHR